MKRALLALLLTGCMFPVAPTSLDGTWCSGKDVATCCVMFTFGPGDAYEADDCKGEYQYGTYAVDGSTLHVDSTGGTYDLAWELSTGPVVRHGIPNIEQTLRLERGTWRVVMARAQ